MQKNLQQPNFLYKILTHTQWEKMKQIALDYRFGSDLDQQDGFLHLSTATQVEQVAKKYFSHLSDGILLQIDYPSKSPLIRWEPNSKGELFPHAYQALPLSLVKNVFPFKPNAFDYNEFPY